MECCALLGNIGEVGDGEADGVTKFGVEEHANRVQEDFEPISRFNVEKSQLLDDGQGAREVRCAPQSAEGKQVLRTSLVVTTIFANAPSPIDASLDPLVNCFCFGSYLYRPHLPSSYAPSNTCSVKANSDTLCHHRQKMRLFGLWYCEGTSSKKMMSVAYKV